MLIQQENPPFTSAYRVMENPTYQSILENTETELEHFNEAVHKMKLESDLIGSVSDQLE